MTHLGKLLTARCEVAIAEHDSAVIRRLIPPSTPDAARRTVAFFNFFREFCPQFFASTVAMRAMAHSKPHSPTAVLSEFRHLQNLLTTASPLRPVPVNACLHIHDFSLNGLGAVVTWSPPSSPSDIHVARFMARSLRDAESRYMPIEGEALVLL